MPRTAFPTDPTFVIDRPEGSDAYAVWRLDPDDPTLLTRTGGGTYPAARELCAVGGYLLSYDPTALSGPSAEMPYDLLRIDPGAPDPLSAAPVRSGTWPKSKFWQFYDHYTADPARTDIVRLVPLTSYVLAWMPTAARGTFMLWSFDPAPDVAGPFDPLERAVGPQDAFPLIDAASELIPLGNYVLERRAATSDYRLWSFDPQAMPPLVSPPVASVADPSIDVGSQFVAAGEHALQIAPDGWRLYPVDPHASDPMAGSVGGALPAGIGPTGRKTVVQAPAPVDAARAATPGTMDFMRERIDHVVVYMLESRTMDSVLGWLYAEGAPALNFVGDDAPFAGNSDSFHNEWEGKRWYPFLHDGGALSASSVLAAPAIDPFHTLSDGVRQQWSGGFESYAAGDPPDMGGFVATNLSHEAMVTFSAEQLPVLSGLAAAYAVSDAWFSAMPGQTVANRAFALTGSNGGVIENCEGEPQYSLFAEEPRRPSVWKTLQASGETDWRIYHSVRWEGEVFTAHLFLRNQLASVDAGATDRVAPFSEMMEDIREGTLPRFSFVEPVWIAPSGATSYHPGATGDMVPAERALRDLYEALRASPAWERTALVITFSKGGGLYDHVPPPAAPPAWPHDGNEGFRYDVLGPRVPTLVVSPLVEPNTVFRSGEAAPFDACSLLSTVLEWSGIPRARWGLGDRVAAAPTFEAVFQRAAPRTDAPALPVPYDKLYPKETPPPAPAGSYDYPLGSGALIEALIPPADLTDPALGLTDLPSVIAHYTEQSMAADGLADPSATAWRQGGQYWMRLASGAGAAATEAFGRAHGAMFREDRFGKALRGAEAMKAMGVWNPMAGFPVNGDPDDGRCKWHVFPPLGLNVIGQKGMLLMHYPPWQALREATSINCMTMFRWGTILGAVGIPEAEVPRYRTVLDVNPVAAPGSGQSEYPNDYFPIMMASAFFDGPGGLDYIPTMLGWYLGGPQGTGTRNTLPLLVCGSPLYDPQAPGWFRTAFKDQMPVDANGTPTSPVLQAGTVRLTPDAERATPYMIANHMIAAGVTGRCTKDPSRIPDIRMYEAQDLTAATFLHLYDGNPDLDPADAKAEACRRWFGNPEGAGPPAPPDPHDARVLCALAQMDLYFCPGPPPHPRYSFEEAMERCAGADDAPCGCAIGPGGGG